MAHPMPIGGMQLVLLPDEIERAKKTRDALTLPLQTKLAAIRKHLAGDKYCQYLVEQGLMSACTDPEVPKPSSPPRELQPYP